MTADDLGSIAFKKAYDEKFISVRKNDRSIAFNADRILTDLILAGISSYQALDVLANIEPYLEKDMDIARIIQLIASNLDAMGVENPMAYLTGSFFQPIVIEFPDGSTSLFNFKQIREFIDQSLKNYNYSSKTYRAIVDEMYRVIKSMRSTVIRSTNIIQMIPTVVRNIIKVNPWSDERYSDDFNTVIKLSNTIETLFEVIPEAEKKVVLSTLLDSTFRVILLRHQYLPGHTLMSTAYLVNNLVAQLMDNPMDDLLSQRDMYILGQLASTQININQLQDVRTTDFDYDDVIVDFRSIKRIIHLIHNDGTVNWIILMDRNGTELYAKFAISAPSARHLIAMAIAGVQTLVTEITSENIRQIEQEGNTILIDQNPTFSIIASVEKVTTWLKLQLNLLANYVEENLYTDIRNFRGKTNAFNEILDPYVDEHFNYLMVREP